MVNAAASVTACAGLGYVNTMSLALRAAETEFVGVYFGDSGVPNYAAAGAGGVFFLGQPPSGSGGSISSTNAAINSAAQASGDPLPFIATDEEGGGVARLSNVIGPIPWQRYQAQQYTPAQLQGVIAQHAAAMRNLGFNMDLAPVMDTAPANDQIGAEGLRSYSEDGNVAAAYGIASLHGMQQSGIVPVIKHFPGLGHANGNTDTQVGVTTPSLGQLQTDDLIPFVQGAAAGAPVVMISHAIVPGLTNGIPASVSPAAYSYLHQNVGFGGLTITDALNAVALSGAGYNQEQAAVAAISSGGDMVLPDGAQFNGVRDAIVQAVNSGALPISRLNDAVIRSLKARGLPICKTKVAVASMPNGNGYWIAGTDGTVTAYGAAQTYGPPLTQPLSQPIVGMASTKDGKGYWLVAADGGIFSFGDAAFYGSMGGKPLNKPIVGMTASATGGYLLVASDGGIFTFGPGANFYGSTGAMHLNQPVVGMATDPTTGGYWLVAADGGIFSFDAPFHGSTGAMRLNQPVVGMAAPATAKGYWLMAADGGIFSFGVPFYGSAA